MSAYLIKALKAVGYSLLLETNQLGSALPFGPVMQNAKILLLHTPPAKTEIKQNRSF